MPRTVHVDLQERGYEIRVGAQIGNGLSTQFASGTRMLIVTDSNVNPLYGEACEDALGKQGWLPTRTEIAPGEDSKNLDGVRRLYARALAAGLDRSSVLVALGGGVVGDLAGFVAASYMRGIGFVQIPTTLLAMVDSSVGGKTGVNLPEGKNLVGAFYQPSEVLVDLGSLRTLPEAEYVAGLAEVVKYGMIWDAVLFGKLEEEAGLLLARDSDLLEDIVARCCEIKAQIVAMDEHESGVRAVLNYGHTFAHAVEQAAGYGEWLHGEAVAVGMLYAADVSAACKAFPGAERDRLARLLVRLGLPVHTATKSPSLSWNAVREAMAKDKKTVQARTRFILSERMGSVVFGCEVEEDVLERAAARLMAKE